MESMPKVEVAKWLAKIDTVVFGTDDVLWKGNEPVDHAVEAFNLMKMKGKRTLIVSNNTILHSSELLKKAKKLGFNVEKEEVLTSGGLVVKYLKERGIEGKVLVCGSKGLELEVQDAGFNTDIENRDPEGNNALEHAMNTIKDPEVRVVLVGQDEQMDSRKMIVACNYLLNTEILFLATGMDNFANAGEYRIPDAYCMVQAIESVNHRKPIILGKPNPQILGDLASELKPESTLVIGNSLKSDILFANLCKFQSLLIGCENGKLTKIFKIIKEKDESKMDLVPDTFLSTLSPILGFMCTKVKTDDDKKKKS